MTAVASLAPHGAIVALASLKAWQRECRRSEVLRSSVPCVRFASLTVEVEQILCTVASVLVAWGNVVHVAYLDLLARSRVDNHVVGTAEHTLGLAVHVPVVGNEVPLLVRTSHHVRSHVNPPKALARHVDALIVVETCAAVIDVAGIVALDDELCHTVACDIAQRHVVKDISAVAIVHHIAVAVVGGRHLDVDVLLAPNLYGCALFLFHTVNYGSNSVCAAC